MMWPDYSCCDFCPYGIGVPDKGTPCEDCSILKAERRRNQMLVDYEMDCEQEEADNE